MANGTSETVIIGAGPAGLAVAAALSKRDRSFIVLEREGNIASSWRAHYQRLRLHTDKRHSSLPYLAMPADYPRYPTREQALDYFEQYAAHFKIEPRYHQNVRRLSRFNGGWQIKTQHEPYQAEHVVVASGYNRRPHRPQLPGVEAFKGTVRHSTDYSRGEAYRHKRVLVIGFGNTAHDIALDLLANDAEVALSVRSPVNVIPREIVGVPTATLAIALSHLPLRFADALARTTTAFSFGNLSNYGFQLANDGPFSQVVRKQRIPVLDTGLVKRIKQGDIWVYPEVAELRSDAVTFVDGREQCFDAIILATGFKPDVSFLPDNLESGSAANEQLNLYFCGFKVTASGMLREINKEAMWVARRIASSELHEVGH